MEITTANVEYYTQVLRVLGDALLKINRGKHLQIITFELDTNSKCIIVEWLPLEAGHELFLESEEMPSLLTQHFGGEIYESLKTPIKRIEILAHTF